MAGKIVAVVLILFSLSSKLVAQNDVPLYTSYTTAAGRASLYDRLVNNSITKNLLLPLTDSTEENWEEAFAAMEVIGYHSPFAESKISSAFDSIAIRSILFQRGLLEIAFSNFSGKFSGKVYSFLKQTNDPKVFAMCAEYLMQDSKSSVERDTLFKILTRKFTDTAYRNPILFMLGTRLKKAGTLTNLVR